jgi:hypothetical protein
MTRFTSKLAIAAVTFALIGGFGPGFLHPAFAGKAGGHEATEHSGKDSAERGNSPDKAGTDKSSADRGRDVSSPDTGSSTETETETPDAGGSGN